VNAHALIVRRAASAAADSGRACPGVR
jgi:hypothetical protein